MSTLQFFTAMGLIVLIFGFAFLRNKKQNKKQRSRKFPSGQKFFSDVELLKMGKEDLKLLSQDDLSFLIDYVGHKHLENPQEGQWMDLFNRASAVRWRY